MARARLPIASWKGAEIVWNQPVVQAVELISAGDQGSGSPHGRRRVWRFGGSRVLNLRAAGRHDEDAQCSEMRRHIEETPRCRLPVTRPSPGHSPPAGRANVPVAYAC